MEGFGNILAVYDDSLGSDDVLEQAVALAGAHGARLTVVSLMRAHAHPAKAMRDAQKRLRHIVPWIVRKGVSDVTTDVLVGAPAVEIIRRVLRDDHDLVVVNAESGRPFRDTISGSTARHLLRKCPCAVWLLKPGRTVPCSGILAAVDAQTHDPSGNELNVKILDLAVPLSRGLGACLHVVHAWEVGGNEGDMLRSEITDETRRTILARHEAVASFAVNGLLARYPRARFEHKIHLPRGRPQRRIADLARRLDVDLVVMGSAGRIGLPRLLMGNAAETVLEWVRCGVLVVKPEGFRTPIAHPDEAEPAGPKRAAEGQRSVGASAGGPWRAKGAPRRSL